VSAWYARTGRCLSGAGMQGDDAGEVDFVTRSRVLSHVLERAWSLVRAWWCRACVVERASASASGGAPEDLRSPRFTRRISSYTHLCGSRPSETEA